MSQKFDQSQFDLLPMLLARRTVLDWTGLDGGHLSELARLGKIRTHPAFGSKGHKYRYYKADVAQLCGMKY